MVQSREFCRGRLEGAKEPALWKQIQWFFKFKNIGRASLKYWLEEFRMESNCGESEGFRGKL